MTTITPWRANHMRAILILFFCVCFGAARAQSLPLPSDAKQTSAPPGKVETVLFPTGPWRAEGGKAIQAQGLVQRKTYRAARNGRSTIQLLAPLSTALQDQGYTILYACDSPRCGGFDFRFTLDVEPTPAMYVDIGDYQYTVAKRDISPNQPQYTEVLISRTAADAYYQITTLGPSQDTFPVKATLAPPSNDTPLAQALNDTGAYVLNDVFFESGKAELAEETPHSLLTLAQYLQSNPDTHIALVGHTDNAGSLEANIKLSQSRAQTVANRVESLGARAEQLTAAGIGFLAPRASNTTPEGRNLNRRVEVVLISEHLN
jgi:outer membrane protein OmpA-like peptidoglycan-associated protein